MMQLTLPQKLQILLSHYCFLPIINRVPQLEAFSTIAISILAEFETTSKNCKYVPKFFATVGYASGKRSLILSWHTSFHAKDHWLRIRLLQLLKWRPITLDLVRVSKKRKLLREMFSWKTILLPLVLLPVASFYFPQEYSTVCLFFNDIHRGVRYTVANFVRIAVNYGKDKASAKGNATNAENLIKSLRFSSYEEKSLCDLKEGIPGDEFNATVDEIAELTNMPIKLKRLVQRARNVTRGNALAVNRLQFKTRSGKMAFGRIVVLPYGDTIDVAYSLHLVTYKLKNKQSKPENARNFKKFSETLLKVSDIGDERDDDGADDLNEISFDLRQDLLAFFHKQAIEEFLKHCDYLIKTLDYGQEAKPEILKPMIVNEDRELEDYWKSWWLLSNLALVERIGLFLSITW